MRFDRKVLALATSGILLTIGAAFAATFSDATNFFVGDVDIEGGDLRLGIYNTVNGKLVISGASSNPNWVFDRNGGDLRIWTTSGGHRTVHLYNSTPEKKVHLRMPSGDLILGYGNVNVDNGDVNLAGDLVFAGSATPTTGTNASITAAAGGDVIVQLGS